MKTAEEILDEKDRNILTVSEDATLYEALKIMNEHKLGAIFVKKDDKIVGVWTERDLLRNVMDEGFNPKTAKIADYMTKDLISAPSHDTIYNLADIYLGRRVRHLLIEKDGEYIGLISPGDVMRASLQEKDEELHELNAMVSWEYYENWRWKKS